MNELSKIHDYCIDLYETLNKLSDCCKNDHLKGYMECLDDIASMAAELQLFEEDNNEH